MFWEVIVESHAIEDNAGVAGHFMNWKTDNEWTEPKRNSVTALTFLCFRITSHIIFLLEQEKQKKERA